VSSTPNAISRFKQFVLQECLPEYCHDPDRGYALEGFDPASIQVTELDAADFLLSLDKGVVKRRARMTFMAHRSGATEVIFWEGHKKFVPRRITLWLEPVIAIGALGLCM
jgi:hypothetical protein